MNAHVKLARSATQPGFPPAGKYKLRVGDYLMLDEAGTFAGHETELVDGNVIVMSPEWIPHMRIKDELAYRLRRKIEDRQLGLFVGTGGSVDLSDVDQPRPDIIVMRQTVGEKAVPRDAVLLLVEVSSSTLTFDIGEKAALYARHEIAEYWIADANARMIHQMWSPAGDSYTDRREVAFGEALRSITIADLQIATASL